MVAQHVAFCPSIFVWVREEEVERSGDRESVVEPKEASVLNILLDPGMSAEPKRTVVPLGLVLLPSSLSPPFCVTGKMERKPVLLTIGFPFTVVRRAVLSLSKKVCDTVLKGPDGGVVWFRAKGRRMLSSGARPEGENLKQEIPARRPVEATHAMESFEDVATEMGNSPRVGMGVPRGVSFEGSVGEMENIERVFDTEFTAKRYYYFWLVQGVWKECLGRGTYISIYPHSSLAKQSILRNSNSHSINTTSPLPTSKSYTAIREHPISTNL